MKYSETIIDDFIKASARQSYNNIMDSLLRTGANALISQPGWDESEYLHVNIPNCVRAYTRDKDAAIEMFKAFIAFLEMRGIEINQKVEFPPIPISNAFERLMFIAKYMQDENHTREDLYKTIWVSKNTIDSDISRLIYEDNPEAIQILGKPFVIPKAKSGSGKLKFESTAHPLFLTPNFTQVIIVLEGLKDKSNNPLFETEARQTATDIWLQLSDYAKNRIRFVLRECLMNEELKWYESLEQERDLGNSFHIEEKRPKDRGFIFDCVKNHRQKFCVEYNENGNTVIYKDCTGKLIREDKDILVSTSKGERWLHIKDIKRIAYSVEELLSEESNVIEIPS